MPRRDDLRKILLIGSGPIVIGQACEFDYSGTQACKALREEGYVVVLVNSNPATIMTDPETADRTYIEPVNPETVAAVIERERPDAILPTLGGQTGLNTAVNLADQGILERFGVRDDRRGPRGHPQGRGPRGVPGGDAEASASTVPRSALAHTWEEALRYRDDIGLPCVIRPILHARRQRRRHRLQRRARVRGDLQARPRPLHDQRDPDRGVGARLEGVRARGDARPADNVVIVCSIENLDPMGVHTGDSITVAPAQTLTDKEYQRMRDASIRIIREIGVETGGSNVQFAVNPKTDGIIVIEMNPRVSRSSALASKATGFPSPRSPRSSRSATRWTRLRNDITRETPACFEPSSTTASPRSRASRSRSSPGRRHG
jgi:carbamoyl-phosphate synthase large subunit